MRLNKKSQTKKTTTKGKKIKSTKSRVVAKSKVAQSAKSKSAVAKKSAEPARKEPEFRKRITKEQIILEYRANARKLSRSILRRWRSRIELEELDSLVDLALCEAADRFDPTKGASFMTFLYYHLRGTLVRAVDIAANLNTISAADYEIDDLLSAGKTAKEQSEGGIFAAADIIDAHLNQEYSTPDAMLYKKEVADISNKACSKLDELEQEVVYRLYVQEEQLIDIAKALGYSRCHISRVKKRALQILHAQLSPVLEISGQPIDDEDLYTQNKNIRKVISRRKMGAVKDELASSYTRRMSIPSDDFQAAAA